MNRNILAAALLAISFAACAPSPERADIPTQWQPSPNYDHRRPNFVILHHTGSDTAERALRVLTDPVRQVSAHYLIARDGTIYQLVDERARAWHAGESRWGSTGDLNSSSLGIELVNDGDEPYPEEQIAALLALLTDIQERYGIPPSNYLGHADVAPQRKVDPGRNFPWRTLAEHGFGIWCEPPLPQPPSPLDATLALQALGYDVSDPEAAVSAFKLHYIQDGTEAELNGEEQSLLYCLLQRSRD